MKTYDFLFGLLGFEKVLEKEDLLDLSKLSAADFCDEVPLYSRYSQLSFLGKLPTRAKDELLLTFGLVFLDQVMLAQSRDLTGRTFAAMTVWETENGKDPIVPGVFVCNKSPKVQLKALRLRKARSEFSRYLTELLAEIEKRSGRKYILLEDAETLPEQVRVFVGPKKPDHARSLPLNTFLPAKLAKSQA